MENPMYEDFPLILNSWVMFRKVWVVYKITTWVLWCQYAVVLYNVTTHITENIPGVSYIGLVCNCRVLISFKCHLTVTKVYDLFLSIAEAVYDVAFDRPWVLMYLKFDRFPSSSQMISLALLKFLISKIVMFWNL